jgi:hypothetical protein
MGENQPTVEKLELNRETVQDLTEEEAQKARGGAADTQIGTKVTASCFCTLNPLACRV